MPKAWAKSSRSLIFLGTRANAPGKGISSCFFDSATGKVTPVSLALEFASPTSFLLSPNKKILYSVSELGNDGKSDGSISAFAIDANKGTLSLLNKVASNGGGPTFLGMDPTGNALVVACFGGGRTNAFRILPDGKLGENTASIQDVGTGPTPRQAAPHVHCAIFSPDNRFVLDADFGADKIFIFKYDTATGALTPHDTPFVQRPAGSGPRQVVFDPKGKFVYLLSELTAMVTVFTWDAKKGTLTEVQAVLATEGPGDRSGAALVMHGTGKFLFTTTRNDNSIEVFKIDATKGTLTNVQTTVSDGKVPWSAALDADGSHLITTNQVSSSCSIYSVNPASGNLTQVASIPDSPAPACAIFVPA
jgi:6-phosphogluconolactonase